MGLTGNYHLVTRHYDVALPQLDTAYDGYRILQVSDVHNALQEIVGGLNALLDAARLARPHVIAITGDLLDRHSPDVTSACALIRGLSAIAPVYYVTGNHERTPLGSDGLPLPYRRVTPERAALMTSSRATGTLLRRRVSTCLRGRRLSSRLGRVLHRQVSCCAACAIRGPSR